MDFQQDNKQRRVGTGKTEQEPIAKGVHGTKEGFTAGTILCRNTTIPVQLVGDGIRQRMANRPAVRRRRVLYNHQEVTSNLGEDHVRF
jgi:hypothetical protein